MGGEMQKGADSVNYDCYVNELGEVADSNQLYHPHSFTVFQTLSGHCWKFFGCWPVRGGGDYGNAKENVMRAAQEALRKFNAGELS